MDKEEELDTLQSQLMHHYRLDNYLGSVDNDVGVNLSFIYVSIIATADLS